MKKKQKNAEQRAILQYFRVEANRNFMMNKDTDPRPPPYNPGRVGQFVQTEQNKAGGVITGRITITVNKEEEETGDRSSTHRETGASSSSHHLSEDKPFKQRDTGASASHQLADEGT